MKRILKICITAMVIAFPLFLLSQTPPHPNGGNPPGGGNVPVGGGAPLGGGLVVMIVMGLGYTAKKSFSFRKLDQ